MLGAFKDEVDDETRMCRMRRWWLLGYFPAAEHMALIAPVDSGSRSRKHCIVSNPLPLPDDGRSSTLASQALGVEGSAWCEACAGHGRSNKDGRRIMRTAGL